MKLRDPDLLRTRAFIGGKWVDAMSGATREIVNPATREPIGAVPEMGAAETRRAIEAASQAFPAWAGQTAKERAAVLRRWYELLMANLEDLATLDEPPNRASRSRSPRARSPTRPPSSNGSRRKASACTGDVIPGHQTDKTHPGAAPARGGGRGDHAVEFPLAMITRKAGLRSGGCTLVCKPRARHPTRPSPRGLAARAGVPAGVLNVITGCRRIAGR